MEAIKTRSEDSFSSPRLASGLMGRPLERVLGLDRIETMYRGARGGGGLGGAAFLDAALAQLEVEVELEPGLDMLPSEGSVVVVANHPLGGIEGIGILHELLRKRRDVKVMANGLLSRIEELDDLSIWVDPFGGDDATKANLGPMREALRHLRSGGVLLVFPAGEVSHLSVKTRAVLDPAWQESTARLIRMTSSAVLPIYVEGRNSSLFQVAGLVSPILRTALLPRELLGRCGKTLRLRAEKLLSNEDLHPYGEPAKLMSFLRLATYALASQRPSRPLDLPILEDDRQVAGPADASRVVAEVAALPADALLHSSLQYEVYCARANEIPLIMHELGRLREESFRAVGEGTGLAVDLDPHDEYYEHLFLWDRTTSEVIGAYRIGRTDELLERFGKGAIYTRTLFRYKTAFLKSIGPALELGRAFVAPARQKSHLPLLLLWQGIGRYLAKNPRYTTLFGGVSISSDYSPVSRYVMAKRLLESTAPTKRRERRSLPTGNFRIPKRSVAGVDPESLAELAGSIDELGRLISGIEPEGQGLPVLLRQYLKLNGRVLAFSEDPGFGDALDALLVVDLRECEARVRARVLGAEGEAQFQRLHGLVAGDRQSDEPIEEPACA